MSRCFPFPPPGYEKSTVRTDRLDFLEKEKHKEKKHKKDKKDKEKREGKEKKDKERSKDKHKDKKDRKEKHKDKKKDREKNKDKSRESEERTERQADSHHVGESSRKSEDIKDSKFKEELVRRIQEEKGAANRPIENFNSSVQRSREGFSAATTSEKERTAVTKRPSNSVNITQRNDVLGQQTNNVIQCKKGAANQLAENFTDSSQRSHEGLNAASTVEKERATVTKMPPNSTNSTQRKDGWGPRINNVNILVQRKTESPSSETTKQKETGRAAQLLANSVNIVQKGNGRVGRSVENASTSVQRFDSPSTSNAAATGMERGTPRQASASPSITIRRPNGIGRPTESFSISTQRKPEAGSLAYAPGKEKDQGNKMATNNIATEHRQINSKPSSMEKIADGRIERMEKVRDGTSDDAKREKDKKSDRHEKKKRKEKDKHKEKKKEKEIEKEKGEQNHKLDDLTENSKYNQIDSLHKPFALPGDGKITQPDENVKKRKNHEMNGSLQNHDMPPAKLSRTALSNVLVENSNRSHAATPLSSMKSYAVNIVKAERILDNNEENIVGKAEAQQSAADSMHQNSLNGTENGIISTKSTHPDSKYLSQICVVPEMTESLEPDDQEWLFDRGCLQLKPKSMLEANEAPQVWAEALNIESADVIALPYVIPF